jgi:hypothetical protein
MFLVPLFPVLGAVAFFAVVWALPFVILRVQRADIGTEDRELDAKTEFMAKWHKGRVSKASRATGVQTIRPNQQPSTSQPDHADGVRSA